MKAVKFMNSTVSKLALSLVFAASLAACGGGDSVVPPVAVVSAPLTVAISPTTASATVAALVAAKSVSFATGIAALGTTAPTTFTFSAPAAGATAVPLTMTSGGVTSKGTLTFGSCIFTFTEQPIGTVLTPPLVITLPTASCNFGVNTTNAAANDTTVNRNFTLNLSNIPSIPVVVPVTVRTDGTILLGNIPLGTGTVVLTTGAAS